MKRVLIIGADFTPSSYPPALRLRYFVQHLKEFGWEPVILTTDPIYYETAVDEENQNLLPPGLEIIRTRADSFCADYDVAGFGVKKPRQSPTHATGLARRHGFKGVNTKTSETVAPSLYLTSSSGSF